MKMRVMPVLIVVLTAAVAIYTMKAKNEYIITIADAFDTVTTIKTYSSKDNTDEYETIMRDADNRLSAVDTESEIYRLNHEGACEISPDTTQLLCDAITYSVQLKYYFDITTNPLCELWDIKNNPGKIPEGISDALKLVGVEAVEVDIKTNDAKIIKDGASITLGGIAKGYVTDRLCDAMRKNGENSALINMGGNIYALGKKPDGKLWNIGILDPKNVEQNAVTLQLSDKAVVTSGTYERYVKIDGKRYHHIIDPKTGYPAESGLISATAIGKSAELCDVLSTAMMVAGVNKGIDLAEKYGIDAVLIDDKTVYYTPGLKDFITLGDDYEHKCVSNLAEFTK